eukprot:1349343-Pyramimonas_sp.AAC.1
MENGETTTARDVADSAADAGGVHTRSSSQSHSGGHRSSRRAAAAGESDAGTNVFAGDKGGGSQDRAGSYGPDL